MNDVFLRTKSATGASGLELNADELAMINLHTLRELTADEIFAFKITACDNEIDREGEAFTLATLQGLAQLYVGKTVLDSNHGWRAENQCARTYTAKVFKDTGKLTSYGEPYARLEVRSYIPRLESTKELIQLIETGIRKEVSVGCAVRKNICSICGLPYWSSECEHRIGQLYNNNATCFIKLEEAVSAYEISFVAVPAQAAAGVTKGVEPNEGNCYLAELHGIINSVKEIGGTIHEMKNMWCGVDLSSQKDYSAFIKKVEPLDPEVEELIQSANALTKNLEGDQYK